MSVESGRLATLRRVHTALKRNGSPLLFIKEGDRWLTFGNDVDLLFTAAPLLTVAGMDFASIADSDKETVRQALLALGAWCEFAEQIQRAPNAKIEIVDDGERMD